VSKQVNVLVFNINLFLNLALWVRKECCMYHVTSGMHVWEGLGSW